MSAPSLSSANGIQWTAQVTFRPGGRHYTIEGTYSLQSPQSRTLSQRALRASIKTATLQNLPEKAPSWDPDQFSVKHWEGDLGIFLAGRISDPPTTQEERQQEPGFDGYVALLSEEEDPISVAYWDDLESGPYSLQSLIVKKMSEYKKNFPRWMPQAEKEYRERMKSLGRTPSSLRYNIIATKAAVGFHKVAELFLDSQSQREDRRVVSLPPSTHSSPLSVLPATPDPVEPTTVEENALESDWDSNNDNVDDEDNNDEDYDDDEISDASSSIFVDVPIGLPTAPEPPITAATAQQTLINTDVDASTKHQSKGKARAVSPVYQPRRYVPIAPAPPAQSPPISAYRESSENPVDVDSHHPSPSIDSNPNSPVDLEYDRSESIPDEAPTSRGAVDSDGEEYQSPPHESPQHLRQDTEDPVDSEMEFDPDPSEEVSIGEPPDQFDTVSSPAVSRHSQERQIEAEIRPPRPEDGLRSPWEDPRGNRRQRKAQKYPDPDAERIREPDVPSGYESEDSRQSYPNDEEIETPRPARRSHHRQYTSQSPQDSRTSSHFARRYDRPGTARTFSSQAASSSSRALPPVPRFDESVHPARRARKRQNSIYEDDNWSDDTAVLSPAYSLDRRRMKSDYNQWERQKGHGRQDRREQGIYPSPIQTETSRTFSATPSGSIASTPFTDPRRSHKRKASSDSLRSLASAAMSERASRSSRDGRQRVTAPRLASLDKKRGAAPRYSEDQEDHQYHDVGIMRGDDDHAARRSKLPDEADELRRTAAVFDIAQTIAKNNPGMSFQDAVERARRACE